MDFEFQNPTRILFGAGNLSRLGDVVREYGKKALLVTGGGSVKRSGVLAKAVASLAAAGIEIAECDGIEPNPRITSVARGAAIARKEGCDVIVAIGGGSVMDASKVISAAALYDGDPWNMILHGQKDVYVPTEALPVITVPTIAATGSEANCGAVITNEESTVKSFIQIPLLYPKVAVMDPELTVSVPANQTAYGICDLITHVTESYFNGIDNTPIQDRLAEGVILTAMEWGPKAIANGNDVEARAQVMWAASVALIGWAQVGTSAPYPVHMMEHTVSAYHDITHAAGLSVINPAWMRFAVKSNTAKFVQFAERIFGLKARSNSDLGCAMEGIDRFEQFLRSIGCPTRFSELGIGDDLFETYARDTLKIIHDENGRLFGRPPMSVEDMVGVFRAAM